MSPAITCKLFGAGGVLGPTGDPAAGPGGCHSPLRACVGSAQRRPMSAVSSSAWASSSPSMSSHCSSPAGRAAGEFWPPHPLWVLCHILSARSLGVLGLAVPSAPGHSWLFPLAGSRRGRGSWQPWTRPAWTRVRDWWQQHGAGSAGAVPGVPHCPTQPCLSLSSLGTNPGVRGTGFSWGLGFTTLPLWG